MVCFWINFCQRHFRDYGVFTECRTPHVVIKRLPIVRKTGGAVWHQAFTLGFANRNTEVSFARTTELTLAALCGVKRDHMVAWFDAGYAFTDFNHNASPFRPRTTGNTPSGSSPERVNASVWQTPVWVTLISTSPFSVVQRQFQRFPAVYREQMQRQHVISSLALPQYGNRFSYLR